MASAIWQREILPAGAAEEHIAQKKENAVIDKILTGFFQIAIRREFQSPPINSDAKAVIGVVSR